MFWVHNTGPIGCLPVLVINNPPKPDNVDSVGCVKSYNEIAQEFNKQLKDKVSELRTQFHDALLILVDVFSVKCTLIGEAEKHGKFYTLVDLNEYPQLHVTYSGYHF